MNKENHEAITRKALGGVRHEQGLSHNALSLIVLANQDSDHQSSGAGMAQQHFCGDDGSYRAAVGDRCRKLIDEALEYAAVMVRRATAEEHYNTALYFVGRALHCVQDFYAHSNWVALGKQSIWNGEEDANLKYCLSTPFSRLKDNAKIMQRKWFKKRSIEDMKAAFAQLRDPSVPMQHPDAHLDYAESWASYAILAGSGTSGYTTAHRLATEHTLEAWKSFLALMECSTSHPNSPAAIAKQRKYWGSDPVGRDKLLGNVLKNKELKDGATVTDREIYGLHPGQVLPARFAIQNLKEHDPGKVSMIELADERDRFNQYFGIKAHRVKGKLDRTSHRWVF